MIPQELMSRRAQGPQEVGQTCRQSILLEAAEGNDVLGVEKLRRNIKSGFIYKSC